MWWIGCVRCGKIPTRLRGMKFSTSSARFALNSVRQQNGPKCTQIVRNEPKRQFRVQWGGSGLRNIPTRLRGTFFCTSSARFAPSSVRQPNGPKCTQIVRNVTKRQFRVQCGESGAFVAKNSDATSWHEVLHLFGPFCTEFRKATKRSQMHQNSTKHTKTSVRVQWGGSGAFVAKNSGTTMWHELLHLFGPFCTEFRKATKRSSMLPNRTKHTKTSV